MNHFEHVFIDSPQQAPSYLDGLPNEYRGWFTDVSSTARIHPFFAEERFSNINIYNTDETTFGNHPFSDDFHDRLRPALRLASAMIEKSRIFWVFVLKARIFFDSNGDPNWNLRDLNPSLRRMWPQVEEELEYLSENTQICWFPDCHPGDEVVYGMTAAINKPYLPVDRSTLRFRMSVSSAFITALNDPDFRYKPRGEQHNFYLLLAVTLVHELAHCLYLYRIREHLQEELTGEGELDGGIDLTRVHDPITGSAPDQEVGWLFEVLLFGGTFQANGDGQQDSRDGINNRKPFDGSRSLKFILYDDDADGQFTIHKISDETMLMLLHERGWRTNVPQSMFLLPDEEESEYESSDYEMSEYEMSEYETMDYDMSY